MNADLRGWINLLKKYSLRWFVWYFAALQKLLILIEFDMSNLLLIQATVDKLTYLYIWQKKHNNSLTLMSKDKKICINGLAGCNFQPISFMRAVFLWEILIRSGRFKLAIHVRSRLCISEIMNSLVSFAFIFLVSILVEALSSTVPTITNNSTNDYTINDTPAPGNVQIQNATGGKSYNVTGNACLI